VNLKPLDGRFFIATPKQKPCFAHMSFAGHCCFLASLRLHCSDNLHMPALRSFSEAVERLRGIEPLTAPWQGAVIPLYYSRRLLWCCTHSFYPAHNFMIQCCIIHPNLDSSIRQDVKGTFTLTRFTDTVIELFEAFFRNFSQLRPK
jgi:hypothetical protein